MPDPERHSARAFGTHIRVLAGELWLCANALPREALEKRKEAYEKDGRPDGEIGRQALSDRCSLKSKGAVRRRTEYTDSAGEKL